MAAAGTRHALAAQPQLAAAGRARRDPHLAVPVSVGTSTAAPSAASHGVTGRSTYRSRPSTRKRGCGLDPDAQVEVAGGAAAASPAALAGEPDALAVADAGRDVDLEVAAVAERDPPLAAARGLLERQLEHGLVVGAARREAVEAAEPAAAPHARGRRRGPRRSR